MTLARKAKPHAGRRGASRNAPTTDFRSGPNSKANPIDLPYLAWISLQRARKHLDCFATQTDEPSLGIVEAADALDVAGELLGECLDQRCRQ